MRVCGGELCNQACDASGCWLPRPAHGMALFGRPALQPLQTASVPAFAVDGGARGGAGASAAGRGRQACRRISRVAVQLPRAALLPLPQHKAALEANLARLRAENERNTQDVKNIQRREAILQEASLACCCWA